MGVKYDTLRSRRVKVNWQSTLIGKWHTPMTVVSSWRRITKILRVCVELIIVSYNLLITYYDIILVIIIIFV